MNATIARCLARVLQRARLRQPRLTGYTDGPPIPDQGADLQASLWAPWLEAEERILPAVILIDGQRVST